MLDHGALVFREPRRGTEQVFRVIIVIHLLESRRQESREQDRNYDEVARPLADVGAEPVEELAKGSVDTARVFVLARPHFVGFRRFCRF